MNLTSDLHNKLFDQGVPCSAEGERQLLQYIQLLEKWGSVYNLTAILQPDQIITRHILDSLAATPYVQGSRLVDVGSGAGLPGIPLAIVLPQLEVVVLDSNAKKTRFMQQAKIELGLQNVQVECQRVERFQPVHKFNTVISRAFASIAEMLDCAGHLCATDGRLLAMKGRFPQSELQSLPKSFEIKAVHPLTVVGLNEERYLVDIRPVETG